MYAKRSMLEIQALEVVLVGSWLCLMDAMEWRATNNNPVLKTSETPSLRLLDMLRRQIKKIGTLSIAISETILKVADVIYKGSMVRQCPGISGVQILARGKQRKIGTKKNIM